MRRVHIFLQHAHNPVDWFPWGEEAFQKARSGGQAGVPFRRILHVPLVPCDGARVIRKRDHRRLLNSRFVPVKVDREERPDVDRIYMTALQAMGELGRVAADDVSHARLETLLRRYVLPA